MKYLYSEKCSVLLRRSMLSFQGQIRPELHLEWSNLGFHPNFLKGIQISLKQDNPKPSPPPPHSRVNVNELSVLLKPTEVTTPAEGSLFEKKTEFAFPRTKRGISLINWESHGRRVNLLVSLRVTTAAQLSEGRLALNPGLN